MENGEATYDIIIPSIPGYGFSTYNSENKQMDLYAVAQMFNELLEKLGYSHYYAQGGDWGAQIVSWLAYIYPEKVQAIHMNFLPGSYSPPIEKNPLSKAEQYFIDQQEKWMKVEGGYDAIQSTKPLTLAAALNDSPTGLAAWIFEKIYSWSDWEKSFGHGLTTDNILTNISIYWFTQTIYTSMRLYQESEKKQLKFSEGEFITPSTGFTIFPDEFSKPPRSWLNRVYNLQYWNEVNAGGHFAAMEQPELLAQEIRNFFSDY